VRILGGRPPLGFAFEMFLDEEGHKVSKSVGRGVTVEQWSRYAPIEVLKYFLILNPRRARKLFLESIPQYVDEYLETLRAWSTSDEIARRNSPLEFVLQSNSARRFNSSITFSLVMNLVPAVGSYERDLLWRYLVSYDPAIEADADTAALAQTLLQCAFNFYKDFVEPSKKDYQFSDVELAQLREVLELLEGLVAENAEEIEKKLYDIGRKHYPDKPGKIFPVIYKALLGQERGPRLGAFIRLARPDNLANRLRPLLGS
jgi:lysyl-tRNA synthetase class 1